MANYHVSKDKENSRWRVTREGADRVSDYADTQGDAEKIAKEHARNSGGGEVRIHRLDGPIRDSDTVAPAKDPFPPRDTKH
jgi:Uncharacterized protein conserved in bacteria (DUF2188)